MYLVVCKHILSQILNKCYRFFKTFTFLLKHQRFWVDYWPQFSNTTKQNGKSTWEDAADHVFFYAKPNVNCYSLVKFDAQKNRKCFNKYIYMRCCEGRCTGSRKISSKNLQKMLTKRIGCDIIYKRLLRVRYGEYAGNSDFKPFVGSFRALFKYRFWSL